MADREIVRLREEIERLLAAALKSDQNHEAALLQSDQVHDDELLALADMYEGEINEINTDREQLSLALRTRDTIGMAKGVLVSALRCTPERAFALLVSQSQAENRKVAEIAGEIVSRAKQDT